MNDDSETDTGNGTPNWEFRTQHDIDWDTLGPEDALWARGALSRAQELREGRVDPGDAYLEGALAKRVHEQQADKPTSAT